MSQQSTDLTPQQALDDLDVILSVLSDPNALSGPDGDHAKAILASSGREKLHVLYNSLPQNSG